MPKSDRKKLKRLKEREVKQQENIQAVQQYDRTIQLKELAKQDDSQRMPIHFFRTRDDYVDERLPLSRDRQLEILSNLPTSKKCALF